MSFLIEGLVDGQWSWQSVGDSREACLFETAIDAQIAINDLADVAGWSRSELRAVNADDETQVAIGAE